MIAGIPATGIGGLFYIGLVLLTPFVELYRRIVGKQKATSFAFILFHLCLASAIIASFFVIGVFLRGGQESFLLFVQGMSPAADQLLLESGLSTIGLWLPSFFIIQLFVLLLIVVILKILALILPKRMI